MQIELPPTNTRKSTFSLRNQAIILGFIFVVALGIRLYNIDQPPLNFHATRQYRSLIIARGYYWSALTSIPEWEKQVALLSQQKQGILEPPIMEFIVAIGYHLLGGERFWLPRLLSSLFWLIGGVFVYLIGIKIADSVAAIFATGFYLFLPFGVVASRSFQPDPLMVMLLLSSVYAILHYNDAPSSLRFAVAAAVSALAFAVKPGSLFPIVGVFVALAISRQGIKQAVLSRTFLVFIATVVTPTTLIYGYGVLTGAFLIGEVQKTLLPQLWISTFFWRGWLINIDRTIGFIPFVGGLLGILMFRQGVPRALMIGLWAGYVIFSFALNYNLATHDYYQIQLIPIVGISIGPIMALVMNRLNQIHSQLLWRTAAWGILFIALLLSLADTRSRLVPAQFEYKMRLEQEIGEQVNHSTNTIILSGDYGVSLEYHGLLSGSPWPLASDLEWEQLAGVPVQGAQERFNALFSKESPEYFIVMDFRELDQQEDLKAFLTQNFSVIAQNDDFMIFDLQRR